MAEATTERVNQQVSELRSQLAGLQVSLNEAYEDLGREMEDREIAEAQLEAARITMVEAVELTLREGPNVGMLHIRQWVDDNPYHFGATVVPHDWLSQWNEPKAAHPIGETPTRRET